MRLPALCAACVIWAGPALACDKFVSIDPIQQKADFVTLRDDKSDPIDRITAFSTLVCSDQIAVRRKALQDGLTASPEIRSEALFRALAANTGLNIRLQDVPGLTDQQYDRIRTAPTIGHNVNFSDPATACVSLYHTDKCDGGYALNVRGQQVDYQFRGDVGTFRLDDGKLSGDVTLDIGRQRLTFPAEITLF